MFAVWFLNASGHEVIVGITNTWSKADLMARNLYSIKHRIEKMEDISTGIYLMEDSMLYTSSKPRRWQITPLRSSDNCR